MNKTVAIVLGGTVPHIDLINLLKGRGYYTILADFLENPPAKDYADEHVLVSTLDLEAVKNLAINRKADIVICTSIDQANATCSYVNEQLGLPHPYGYQTALDVTDKRRMKEIMWENHIPTSRYIEVQSFDEVDDADLAYPLIIKPADSNSANGVKKVANRIELKQYLPLALNASRNGYAIVEEFVEGVEISAYSFVSNGVAKLLMAQERISVIEGEENVIKCYASIVPARISQKAMQNAENVLQQIVSAFKLKNTALFFQGIVRGDEISVIEFAPRTGGGISTQTIKLATGFDLIEASTKACLGENVDFGSWHAMTEMYCVNQLYGSNGVFDHLDGVKKVEPYLEKLKFYKSKGETINDRGASSSRIAVMLVKGKSVEELRKKVQFAMDNMEAFDVEGNPMLRHDLNINNLWDSIPRVNYDSPSI